MRSSWWSELIFRLRAALRRQGVRSEIDGELAYHIQMRTRDLEASGMDRAPARREAERRFGDYTRIRRECHELQLVEAKPHGAHVMPEILQDLRFAGRSVRKSPGFALVVILTLALGIGANSAIFSIVDGVLLQRLPYDQPDELVRLWQSDRLNGTGFENFSLPDFFDVQERNSVFTGLAATMVLPMTQTDDEADPRQVLAANATHDLLTVLGVSPILGRWFLAEEDLVGGERVALIGYSLWMGRFGGERDVLGRSVTLDGNVYRVIGVMGPTFDYPSPNLQFWVPLQLGRSSVSRGTHSFRVVARLSDGVASEEAAGNLAAIAAALEEEYPTENQNRGMWPQSLHESVVGNVRPALLVLLGAVGLVLLIACANVANLLFARGSVREREVAIRVAMGAGRTRLLRQFLTESVVLAGLGGIAGLGVAFAGLRLVGTLGPQVLPRQGNIDLDVRVLGVTVTLSIVTGVLFGLLPALHASQPDLQAPLKDGTRSSTAGTSRQRLRSGLVVVEVAMAVALVSGAGLLIKSFWRLNQVDPGFNAARVVTLGIQLPASRYPQARRDWPNYPEVLAFEQELLERLRGASGVDAAAVALNAPTSGGWTTRFQLPDRPLPPERQLEEVRIRVASAGFMETAGIPLLQGRGLTARDDRFDAPPVALINEAFAERYFPDEDPMGKRINNWGVDREIVGVVKNVKFMGLSEPVPPAVYPTFSRMPFTGFTLLVRASGDPMDLLPLIRRHVQEMDPDLPLSNVRTLHDLLGASVAQPRFNMLLLGVFAAVAMTLAAVGIYGVISYGVSQRTQEIGVRISLGAQASDVSRQIVGQGLKLALTGLGVGLAVSLVLTRALASLLFGVGTADLTTFVAVAVMVGFVAAVAAFIPARRASRVDPMVALRSE